MKCFLFSRSSKKERKKERKKDERRNKILHSQLLTFKEQENLKITQRFVKSLVYFAYNNSKKYKLSVLNLIELIN